MRSGTNAYARGMSAPVNHRIRLAARPHGVPAPQDFQHDTAPLPVPGPGEALLRTLHVSLDPYVRGRMNDARSYAAPMAIGDVVVGATIAEVVSAESDDLAPGDIVLGYGGWQEYSVEHASSLRVLDPAVAPVTTALGVLGMPGFTAYAGLLAIGKPQAGETVAVAAAAGPVGSAVAQIARLRRGRGPPRPGPAGPALGRGARRHRRVLRERGRRRLGGRAAAAERVRARARVRARRELQRDLPARGAGPLGAAAGTGALAQPHPARVHPAGVP